MFFIGILLIVKIFTTNVESLNIFRVQDDLPENQLVGTVDYSNQPSLINYINQQMSLEFRLQRGNKMPASLFSIDSTSGKIFSQKVIDREEICKPDSEFFKENLKFSSDCQFELQVMISVKDSDTKPIPEFVDVLIVVDDRNDHTPVFRPNSIVLSLKEDALPGTKIKLPQAIDRDSHQNSVQNYSLEKGIDNDVWSLDVKREQRPNSDLFIISEVYLELRGLLDREKVQSYNLKVVAFDGVHRQPSSYYSNSIESNILSITVNVEDVNDNRPTFMKPESEYLDHYDIKDDLSVFNLVINESENIKNPILQLRAEDKDLSLLDHIKYKISEDNQPYIKSMFNLSQNGQLYVNKRFDFEEYIEHLINFYVTDNQETTGLNKLLPDDFINRVRGQIKISVVDRNDEFPKIEIEYFNTENSAEFAAIKENAKPMEFLGTIIVEDADVNPKFSNIDCKLTTYYGGFPESPRSNEENIGIQLIEHTKSQGKIHYNLLTSKSFDREEKEIYQYRFICKDAIADPNEVSQVIKLKILDENDNEPSMTILQKDNMKVFENSPVGTRVGKVLVIDKDKGLNARVNLEILPEYNSQTYNAMDLFSVDSMTGEITTKILIDREGSTPPLKSIPVILKAKDGGSPSLESQIRFNIEILDENDNKPEFHICPMHFSVRENEPGGICVGEISVFDLDQNANSLNLRIKQYGLPFQIWSVDEAEQEHREKRFYLNTTQSLDREKRASYEFSIQAVDNGHTGIYNRSISHTSTCEIIINIEDVNDNDPIITFPQTDNKTFLLSNKELINYDILTINSKDSDLINGPFVHDLLYLGPLDKGLNVTIDNFLRIDPTSGIVQLSRNMKESENGNYLFKVIVKDMGVPIRESSIYFIVKVTDIPARSSHQNYFTINEGASEKSNYGLLRFGNDGILILALGLVLLLLLATLGLILFARNWHINHSMIHGSNSKYDRCLRFLFCCISPSSIPMSQSNIRSDYTKSFGSLKYPVHYEIQGPNSPISNSVYGVMDPTYQINRNRLVKSTDTLLKSDNFDGKIMDDSSLDSNLTNYKYYTNSTTIAHSNYIAGHGQTNQKNLSSDRYATLAHDGSKFILHPIQITQPGTPSMLLKDTVSSPDENSSSTNTTSRPINNLYQTLQHNQPQNNQIMILDPGDMKLTNSSEGTTGKSVSFSQGINNNDGCNPWSSYV